MPTTPYNSKWQREYRAANRKKFAAKKRAYRESRREKLVAYDRAYYAAHRERILERQCKQGRKKRAKKRAEGLSRCERFARLIFERMPHLRVDSWTDLARALERIYKQRTKRKPKAERSNT